MQNQKIKQEEKNGRILKKIYDEVIRNEAGYLGFCTGARCAVRIMAEIFAGEQG